MQILKVINLSFAYNGPKVLEEIDFSLSRGEFCGIIGPNGGGKSTLLKCILGLLKPLAGSVLAPERIGYVPQSVGLNKAHNASVLDVVLCGALRARDLFFTPKKLRAKALEKLELVGMSEHFARNIHALSGGQIQRVLIARALMQNSSLLLLDEPTANIDAAGQIEVFALLERLAHTQQMAVLCVCHDVALISAFASRLLHISRRFHEHEFCEHERAARRSLLFANRQDICALELLEQVCNLPHAPLEQPAAPAAPAAAPESEQGEHSCIC